MTPGDDLTRYKLKSVDFTGNLAVAVEHLLSGGAVTWASKRINVVMAGGDACGFRTESHLIQGNNYTGATDLLYKDSGLLQEFISSDAGPTILNDSDYYLLTRYELDELCESPPERYIVRDEYAPNLTAASIMRETAAINPLTFTGWLT